MTPRYPVLVDLAGQGVLVVHGGAVATRKVRGLQAVGAHVTVCAPELHVDLLSEVQAESGTDARLDWRAAVHSGMLSLIREGHRAEAKERLQACLSSSSD